MRKRRKTYRVSELDDELRCIAHSLKFQDKQMELIDKLREQGYPDKAIGEAIRELAERQISEYNSGWSRMSDETIVEYLNSIRQEEN